MSWGRECQEEGTARAKAWGREGAWAVPEMVQKLSYLEGSGQGDKKRKKVVGCGGRGEILSLCQLCFDSDDSGDPVVL